MKNTWRTSYLGFTDNKKPMQKARIENTLDNLIRHNGETMYEKEWAFALLLDGYRPDKEENYSYYSRRLDDYTKPKTLYKLRKEDSWYEVTKTVYDFVGYLLDNEMTTLDKAIAYAENEAIQLEKEQREAAEKEAKEKEERRIQAEKEKQERKERHEKQLKEWHENGKQYMNDTTIQAMRKAILYYWEDIKKIVRHDDIEKFIENGIESYTGIFGCREKLQGKVKNAFFDDINKDNLQLKIDREIFTELLSIKEDDKPITVTAKVNAFLDNREYKGAAEVVTESYYIRVVNEGFKERQGEKKTIDGIVFYVEKFDGVYKATEARSGSSITTDKTKAELMKKVRTIIEDKKELLERNIESMVKKFGLSPLYEMKQAQ